MLVSSLSVSRRGRPLRLMALAVVLLFAGACSRPLVLGSAAVVQTPPTTVRHFAERAGASLDAVIPAADRPPPELPPADPKPGVLNLIYVHGFGGPQADSRIAANLQRVVGQQVPDVHVWTYLWDSGDLRPQVLLANWDAANARTPEVGDAFYRDTIAPLEAAGTPYVLVVHSLGTKVIFRAIDQAPQPLEHLQGIYLMGAAVPHDSRPPTANLPPGLRIVNYHSPRYDTVLKVSYYNAESTHAAGAIGFTNPPLDRVLNLPVAATHTEKPLAYASYAEMADAIGWCILWDQGRVVPGDPLPTPRSAVTDGDHAWFTVATFTPPDATVTHLLQHSKNTGHYRTVALRADGHRDRVAWGYNPHALLDSLGYRPPTTPAGAGISRLRAEVEQAGD